MCRQVPRVTPGAGKANWQVCELHSRTLLLCQTFLSFRHQKAFIKLLNGEVKIATEAKFWKVPAVSLLELRAGLQPRTRGKAHLVRMQLRESTTEIPRKSKIRFCMNFSADRAPGTGQGPEHLRWSYRP